jgi:hypothetical protein
MQPVRDFFRDVLPAWQSCPAARLRPQRSPSGFRVCNVVANDRNGGRIGDLAKPARQICEAMFRMFVPMPDAMAELPLCGRWRQRDFK